MNREIKFRTWCEERKEMLQLQKMSLKTGKCMPYGWNLAYEFTNIMQYTGLKDKNGKDIYEGDISKSHEGYIREVIWQDNSWMYKLVVNRTYQGEAYTEVIYNHMGDTSHRYFGDEVIGNIYEFELEEIR